MYFLLGVYGSVTRTFKPKVCMFIEYLIGTLWGKPDYYSGQSYDLNFHNSKNILISNKISFIMTTKSNETLIY